MNAAAREKLWLQLCDAGVVSGPEPEPSSDHGPWYIRAMIGAAAWVAAVFLLVFVGLGLNELVRTSGAAAITGIVVCVIAVLLLRFFTGTFTAQFGLAVSLTGQALFAFGILGIIRGNGWPGTGQLLAVAAFEVLLIAIVSAFVHRVFCTFAAVFAFCYALETAGLGTLGLPVVAALFAAVELDEARLARFPRAWPAVGIGLALAIIAVLPGQLGADDIGLWRPRQVPSVLGPWFSNGAMGAVFFAAAVWLLVKSGIERRSPAGISAIAGAFALAVASTFVPGLAAGLLIVLVGFATTQRPLMALGIVALLAAMSRFYYTLAATMLVKSAALFATGALLLALVYALRRAVVGERRNRDA